MRQSIVSSITRLTRVSRPLTGESGDLQKCEACDILCTHMRQSDEDWVILCHRHQADEMAKQDPDYAIRSNINNTNIVIKNANINTINMVTTQIIVAKAPPFSQVHNEYFAGIFTMPYPTETSRPGPCIFRS